MLDPRVQLITVSGAVDLGAERQLRSDLSEAAGVPSREVVIDLRGVTFMEHAGTDVDLSELNIRQLFRDHVYGCFIEDQHGVDSIDVIGEDNIMCETDYPHSDSTWPDTVSMANKWLAHLSDEVQHKITVGNASRIYNFTPADPAGS